jgi:Golgi SNAP receptor complex protein 1
LAIKRKKNKDAVILAAVVAACTIFVLLYYMSK